MFRSLEFNKSVYNVLVYHKNVLNNMCLRFVCTSDISKQFEEPSNYNDKDDNVKISKKCLAKSIADLLDLRPSVARNAIKLKKGYKISNTTIKENYECSLKNGIFRETLQKFPEILVEVDVPLKIVELKTMPYDINITTPLLSLPYKHLKTYVNGDFDINRITLLSELLEIDELKVCQILAQRNFLFLLSSEQIINNVKLLTDYGITKEHIIKDLWVLRYSTNKIKGRLDVAKNNGIELFKTWMVRVQPEIFETYIRRRSDKKLILGDSSLTQYLSERLECTEEIANYIISKQPALQNKSLKKMNEIIDCLFSYGFKAIHICRVPKILLHSVETTRKRLKELEAKGMHLDSLYILTKSQRQYMHYYESLVKNNNNKLKSM